MTLAALVLHCGSRSGLEDAAGTAGPSGDAASPQDAAADVAAGDDSSCTPAPAGGTVLGTFPPGVLSIAITVAGGSAYAGTTALAQPGPLYAGALARVPASGGPTQPLAAPEFNFGSLASDGARLYYAQTTGKPTGPNGAAYQVIGVASLDLATGDVHSIATAAPPWSTSSNLTSTMIAATPLRPGVVWIGGAAGAGTPTTLSAWDPQSDAVTSIATGQALSGVAVDAAGVYWADTGGGQGITVYRSPVTGGPKTALATVAGGTHGQLLGVSSADAVFVSDYATGAIQAVSKAGGPVRLLVRAASSWVNDYAWVDDVYLYWTENETPTVLRRVPVAGGPAEVVPTRGQIQSLAFDACNRYVGSVGPTQIFVQPK